MYTVEKQSVYYFTIGDASNAINFLYRNPDDCVFFETELPQFWEISFRKDTRTDGAYRFTLLCHHLGVQTEAGHTDWIYPEEGDLGKWSFPCLTAALLSCLANP